MEDLEPNAGPSELQAVLDEVAFARQLRLEVVAAEIDACTLRVPYDPGLERPGGMFAGHVYMATADIAFWLAIMTRLGTATRAVTAQLTSSFLSPARKEPMMCAARILRLGRRQAYGVAECRGEDGRIFTHHTITYALNPG